MTTHTSWTAVGGDGRRWSLIRSEDRSPGAAAPYARWYVKGPPGLYGPFEQDQAARCFAAKVGVPNAVPPVPDETPVEPLPPWAPDSAECGTPEASVPGVDDGSLWIEG